MSRPEGPPGTDPVEMVPGLFDPLDAGRPLRGSIWGEEGAGRMAGGALGRMLPPVALGAPPGASEGGAEGLGEGRGAGELTGPPDGRGDPYEPWEGEDDGPDEPLDPR